jgi:hypothetical protein
MVLARYYPILLFSYVCEAKVFRMWCIVPSIPTLKVGFVGILNQ